MLISVSPGKRLTRSAIKERHSERQDLSNSSKNVRIAASIEKGIQFKNIPLSELWTQEELDIAKRECQKTVSEVSYSYIRIGSNLFVRLLSNHKN